MLNKFVGSIEQLLNSLPHLGPKSVNPGGFDVKTKQNKNSTIYSPCHLQSGQKLLIIP